MLRLTLAAVLLITRLWSYSALALNEDAREPSPMVLAEMPGVSVHDTFDSLDKAIYCLRGTKDNCAAYGFPADVLGAAYGLNDEGRYFKPELWRIWVPRLERALANSKRGPIDAGGLPLFGSLDIPMFGRQLYDFDIIRALVATDLFPYRMSITYRRSKGLAVPFVQLLSSKNPLVGALLVKACFQEAKEIKGDAKDSSGVCAGAIENLRNLQKNGTKPVEKWAQLPAKSRLRNPLLHTVGWTGGRAEETDAKPVAAAEDPNPCEKNSNNSPEVVKMLAHLCYYTKIDGLGEPVKLQSSGSELHCIPYEELNPESRGQVNKGGCLYWMKLNLTPSASGMYQRIKVRLHVSDQTVETCGPPSLEVLPDKPDRTFNSDGCGFKMAKFSLFRPAFNSMPGMYPVFDLKAYVRPAMLTSKQLIVVLLGVDSGWSGKVFEARWCGPEQPCGEKDKQIINELDEQP